MKHNLYRFWMIRLQLFLAAPERPARSERAAA
jgi:hypothetical protein